MAELALRHCSPIKKGTKPIRVSIASSLLTKLQPGWHFVENIKAVEREFSFKDYYQTINFVNAIAWIANTENHHPDLEVSYNRCKVTFTTHEAKGLTVNDFICAAKIDSLLKGQTGIGTSAIATTAQPDEATPALDTREVEVLLNNKTEAHADKEETTTSKENNLELIDPDESPTLKQAPNPQGIDNASASDDEDTVNVILPPGMIEMASKAASDDPDEDATFITPFNDPGSVSDDLEEEKTMVLTAYEEEKTQVINSASLVENIDHNSNADTNATDESEFESTIVMQAVKIEEDSETAYDEEPEIRNEETMVMHISDYKPTKEQ